MKKIFKIVSIVIFLSFTVVVAIDSDQCDEQNLAQQGPAHHDCNQSCPSHNLAPNPIESRILAPSPTFQRLLIQEPSSQTALFADSIFHPPRV